MTGRTHDLAAFTALTIAFVILPSLPEMTLATAIVAFGANFIGGLFPDIDQPTSDFWDNFRLGPFVAQMVIPRLGGHRHISHSLVGVVLIGFTLKFFLDVITSIVLIDMVIVWQAFLIGVVSHLVMDMFTKAGIPLFWPLKWKFGIPPIKRFRMTSGKFAESYIVFPGLLLLNFYLLHQHYGKVLEFLRNSIRY